MAAPAPPSTNVINNHVAKRAPSRHDGAAECAQCNILKRSICNADRAGQGSKPDSDAMAYIAKVNATVLRHPSSSSAVLQLQRDNPFECR
jgi:hypothetical protein